MSTDSSYRMTEGSIWKTIVSFALPVFWGQLFQQLYNVVDSLVVGNFVGSDALAAVGSSGSLIFLFVGFFGGVFTGAGVVISRYFGANDRSKVERAVHTSVAFGLAVGVFMTVIGIIFSPYILRLIGTPDDVLPNSLIYFRIYFSGIISVIMYNTANGIFQAVGDSKHPLYYLIVSSILNVILDLLFVLVFKWAIAGAAIATVISQSVSVILAFARLFRLKTEYSVKIKKIRFDKEMLIQIIQIGIPSGIQNSIIAFANLVVQSNINSFEKMAMAGCGSYSKLEGFAFIPITSFAMSMTTFVGQNLGANELERAKKGARFGIITCMAIAEAIGLIIFIFAPFFVSLFNREPEVVAIGSTQCRTETLFYCLLAFSHSIAGILRGAGKSKVPMLVMMICWCIIRVTYLTVILKYIHDIRCVFWCYPLTWCLSSIIFLIYYLKADWVHGFEKIRSKEAPQE